MIAATYTQGAGFKVGDVPVPGIADDEILLRVDAAAICGTDVKIVRHGHRKLKDGQTIVLGHEFVGTIEQVGRRVGGFEPGLRVGVAPNVGCGACDMCGRGMAHMCPAYSAFGIDRDGAQTQYVAIPAKAIAQGNVILIRSDVSSVSACLAEPLSCAISGVQAAQVRLGDSVLIYGAGPMGLLNVAVASISGAARVIIVDRNAPKREAAIALGATDAIDPQTTSVPEWVDDQTRGRGVDAIITAAPAAQLQQEAIGLLAPFGRLCLFAGLPRGADPVPLDTNAIHYKQLIVTGMTGGSPAHYRDALRLIESGRVDVSRVISDVFPLSDIRAAYDCATSGKAMKVVLSAS
jgi:L-iditol 2-dehydrogenase